MLLPGQNKPTYVETAAGSENGGGTSPLLDHPHVKQDVHRLSPILVVKDFRGVGVSDSPFAYLLPKTSHTYEFDDSYFRICLTDRSRSIPACHPPGEGKRGL